MPSVPCGSVDQVGGHHPIGRVLAAADRGQAGHGAVDHVTAADAGRVDSPGAAGCRDRRGERPDPREHASDVLSTQRSASSALAFASR